MTSRSPGRGRPRLYPADVARDGAPIFTMRLAPELLDYVREQGGSAYVRALIEADRQRTASGAATTPPLERVPEAPPESSVPHFLGGPWLLCPAPASERQRLERELGTLWAVVHLPSRQVVGLLPGVEGQAQHLHTILSVRFARLTPAELTTKATWREFEAQLVELGLLVPSVVAHLRVELDSDQHEDEFRPDERQWIQAGWGVARPMGLESVLLDLPVGGAWAVGHVPSRRVLGIITGSFERAVRFGKNLAERFGSVEKLSWEQFLRKRGLLAEIRRLREAGSLRASPVTDHLAEFLSAKTRRRRERR